jgi:hypothetical protein
MLPYDHCYSNQAQMFIKNLGTMDMGDQAALEAAKNMSAYFSSALVHAAGQTPTIQTPSSGCSFALPWRVV